MTAPTSPPARRVRLPGPKRREQLLDVAADIVVAEGIDAVTMEGVAARAGVSKGLGYAYFDNRDALLVELFDREIARLDARIAAAIDGVDGFEDRLRAMVRVLFEVTVERGVLMGALQQAKLTDGPLEARRAARQQAVDEYFADLVVAEFGIPRQQALIASSILLAGNAAVIGLWISGRARRREITDVLLRLVLGGLRALAEETAGSA